MINIGGPFNSLASTQKLKRKATRDAAVAGTEVTTNAPKVVATQERRRKDRRKKSIKPLIEMRSGRDRRKSDKPSVDIQV